MSVTNSDRAVRGDAGDVEDLKTGTEGDGTETNTDTEGGEGGSEREERRPLSKADQARAAIAERARAIRDGAEDVESEPADSGSDDQNAAAAASSETQNDDGAKADDKAAVEKPAAVLDENAEVTLVINGEKVKKSLKDVTALAQQYVAGDNKLETAKQIANDAKSANEEARRLLEEVKQLRSGAANPPTTDTVASQPDHSQTTRTANQPPAVDPAKLRSISERLRVGDDDEAQAALAELISETSPKERALSEADLDRLLDQRLGVRLAADREKSEIQSEIDGALNHFATKHADIMNDDVIAPSGMAAVKRELVKEMKKAGATDEQLEPHRDNLTSLTTAYIKLKRANHISRGLDDVIDAAANGLKAKYNLLPTIKTDPAPQERKDPVQSQSQQRPAPQSDPKAQARLAAKRDAPQQPRSANVRGGLPAAPRPKTVQEILAEKRKERGQRTY
jgi:hypothetical protein